MMKEYLDQQIEYEDLAGQAIDFLNKEIKDLKEKNDQKMKY